MEQTEQRVLCRYGDTELFYAEAEDGSWRLPLLITWCEDKAAAIHYAHIRPAVCLYVQQALTLQHLLKPHDIQGRADQWVITRRMCEALLRKAPGITPAFYYKWPTDDGPPIELQKPIRTSVKQQGFDKRKTSSFVEWLAKERGISSSIINAVLRGVADDGPVWMIRYRQPLDLGFCRLVAAPFRANWKEIVAFKCKHMKLRTLLRLPEAEVYNALEDVDFPSILTSPHNVALRRGWKNEADVGRIDYTLECIPSDSFEATANRIEGERCARGPTAYLTEFEDTVEALYKSLVLALRSYLGKVIRPHAEVGLGRKHRVLGFLPVLGRRIEVRGTPLTSLPIRGVATDHAFSVFGSDSDAHLIHTPVAKVPKMPNLLPEPSDMRGCEKQGDMDKPTDGEAGDAWVCMLPPGKGGPAEQPVLVGGPNPGDGLVGTDDAGAINI